MRKYVEEGDIAPCLEILRFFSLVQTFSERMRKCSGSLICSIPKENSRVLKQATVDNLPVGVRCISGLI